MTPSPEVRWRVYYVLPFIPPYEAYLNASFRREIGAKRRARLLRRAYPNRTVFIVKVTPKEPTS